MYDAWAAYDPVPVGCLYRGKSTAADIAAARREAIRYAAYRMLRERFVYSKSARLTLANLDAQMAALALLNALVSPGRCGFYRASAGDSAKDQSGDV